MPRLPRRALLGALVATPALGPAHAQPEPFPNRPLRLIIPFPPGGSVDVVGRLLVERLAPLLGQPMVVDNRPGGATAIGAVQVARSPADGYTLLYGTPATQMVNPSLMRSLPYDPDRDFAAIVSVMRAPNLLAVHPSLGVTDVAGLIALAKRRPGALSYASNGIGTSNHLSGEMLKSMAGIDLLHVPHRGFAAYAGDLLAGRIGMAFGTISDMLPHTRSGGLVALAVTSAQRTPLLPEIPAIAETVPGYEAVAFNYIAGPAGLPEPVVARLNTAFNQVLAEPEVVRRMAETGVEAISGTTPAQTEATIRTERARWKQVIEAAGIQPE